MRLSPSDGLNSCSTCIQYGCNFNKHNVWYVVVCVNPTWLAKHHDDMMCVASTRSFSSAHFSGDTTFFRPLLFTSWTEPIHSNLWTNHLMLLFRERLVIKIFIMKLSLNCGVRLCFVINFNYKNALFFRKSHIAHLSFYWTTRFFAYQFQTASVLCYVLHFSCVTPAVLPVSAMCFFWLQSFVLGCIFYETVCITFSPII